MIHFVVSEQGSFSMRYYLAEEGTTLSDRVRIVPYEELPHLARLPLGTWVFTEIDRLSAPERELVVLAWQRLRDASPQVRLLNHPDRVLSRHALLRALHEAGLNRFRAFRAQHVAFGGGRCTGDSVEAAELNYPVFVRFADLHTGSLTPLLGSPPELEGALAGLLASRIPIGALLVVEFCDTRDAQGVYRKYSAFKVGEQILPRYMECSREWMVKWDHRIFDEVRAALERDYLDTNPHEAWVREIFRIGGVDYGRVDYGVLAGEPQAWEINTNPTIGRGPGPRGRRRPDIEAYKQLLAPGFASFYQRFERAWRSIDSAADPLRHAELAAPQPLVRAVRVVEKRRRREDRGRALLRAVLTLPWVRPLSSAVKRALAARAARRLRGGRAAR